MSSNDEQEEKLDEDLLRYGDFDTVCTICQAEFLDPEDLAIHIVQFHPILNNNAPNYKTCNFCTYTYINLMSYAEHLRNNHITSLKYCSFCLRAFDDYNQHEKHEKMHQRISKKFYSCLYCENIFNSTAELSCHDYENHIHENDGVSLYKCLPYLSVVLNIKSTTFLASLHMENVYECGSCSYSTADVTSFINHSIKSSCQPYACSTCCNIYKSKKNLIRHLSKGCNNSSSKKSLIKCPECTQIFYVDKYFKHKKECRVIKCYSCGINFGTMYELTEHQSKEHPLAVELKSCSFCSKECVGNLALMKHIERSHKPELPLYKYRCVTCDTVYKHPQKLFGHYFSKHKDLAPYTCKICDTKFKLRKKFTLHIKLDHKSVGFVEFDENYHVFFTDKMSENPFIPKSIYTNEIENMNKDESKKSEGNNDLFLTMNSEVSVTETEGNQTEIEETPKPKLKRKRVKKVTKEDTHDIEVLSSDDETLLVIKKRIQKSMPKILKNRQPKKKMTFTKKRFTCQICKKYCYTYQNYYHHISLHSNKEYKKCIKCSLVFRSKEKLNKHIASEHSTSKLTETLKNILEKRKKGQKITDSLPNSEKFRRTIKKAAVDSVKVSAIITEVDKLSVQKFIENFTPEGENKSDIDIKSSSVSIKEVTGPLRPPIIKLTKLQLKPETKSFKLAMPVKYKDCYTEKFTAKMKLVNITNVDHQHYNYDEEMEPNESIPEVAEEVMLEEKHETQNVQIPHKIVIPKLPIEYKDMKIAHLLPEAPYYKIVKVDDVLKMQELEANNTKLHEQRPKYSTNSDTIKLPDGTKLVHSNPLAHLLGNKTVEKVLEPLRNKYYKPKIKNIQGLLADALNNLNKPTLQKKRKRENVSGEETSKLSRN